MHFATIDRTEVQLCLQFDLIDVRRCRSRETRDGPPFAWTDNDHVALGSWRTLRRGEGVTCGDSMQGNRLGRFEPKEPRAVRAIEDEHLRDEHVRRGVERRVDGDAKLIAERREWLTRDRLERFHIDQADELTIERCVVVLLHRMMNRSTSRKEKRREG